MKIIGGKYKGKNFYRPFDIRPTQNMTRKAIFDILGPDIVGETVLDLFSGSGAIGLEALSRGAKRVCFVEKDPKCVKVIYENLKLLDICSYGDEAQFYEVFSKDAFACIKQLAAEKRTFDTIILDPPYDRDLAKKALKLLDRYDILQPNSLLVIEHQRREILPESVGRIFGFKQRKYGNTILSLFKVL